MFETREVLGVREIVLEDVDLTDIDGNEYDYDVLVTKLSDDYEHMKTPNRNIVISKKLKKDTFLPHAGAKENIFTAIVLAITIVYGKHMVNMKKMGRRVSKLNNFGRNK